MLSFFVDCSSHAPVGWKGEKRWSSQYGELRIAAWSSEAGATFDLLVQARYHDQIEERALLEVEWDALSRFTDHLRPFLGLSAEPLPAHSLHEELEGP